MKKRLLSISRRILTEIAVVGATSIVVIIVLQKLYQPGAAVRPLASMEGPPVAVGSKVSIKSVEFRNRPSTLLLVSSPHCHFCLESKGFHRRLIADAESHNIPVFVAVPDPSSSAAYVSSFNLRPGRLKAWSDLSGSVEGTPTLMAIDPSGRVARLWVGELQPAGETAVLEAVSAGKFSLPVAAAQHGDVREFSPEALDRLRRTEKLDIIDVRERSDVRQLPPGVVNVPLQEVPFRAAYDIAPEVLHVIDCRALTPELCEQAVQVFRGEGLRVGTMGRGTYQASWCRATLLAEQARN